MNNNYFPNPTFPGNPMPTGTPNQQSAPSLAPSAPTQPNMPSLLPGSEEQSFVENILRINRGKVAKFYMTFPDSLEWRDKIFTGTIEAAGRDHIIISDPNTGLRHLLLRIYLDYVDFDEPINYVPSFETPPR